MMDGRWIWHFTISVLNSYLWWWYAYELEHSASVWQSHVSICVCDLLPILNLYFFFSMYVREFVWWIRNMCVLFVLVRKWVKSALRCANIKNMQPFALPSFACKAANRKYFEVVATEKAYDGKCEIHRWSEWEKKIRINIQCDIVCLPHSVFFFLWMFAISRLPWQYCDVYNVRILTINQHQNWSIQLNCEAIGILFMFFLSNLLKLKVV